MRAAILLGIALVLGVTAYVFQLDRTDDHGRVVVIGLDGADWDILDPLMEQGRLPHLLAIKERGTCGPLMTLQDIPLSPVIWTSIATGKGPAEHGITWFLVDQQDGSRAPVRSSNRQVAAIWNILGTQNRSSAVVGWWATAPAESIAGVMISDALGYHGFGRAGIGIPDDQKTFPADEWDAARGLMPPLQQIDHSFARRFFHLSADEYALQAHRGADQEDAQNPVHLFQQALVTTEGYIAITRRLLEKRNHDLFMVYLESTDSLSHLFMKYAPPQQEWVSTSDFERYKDVVDCYYEYVDGLIGGLLETVTERDTVLVISDHGFRIGDARPLSRDTVDIRGAHLDHEPEGILLAAGPSIRKGHTIEGASVLDITPTLLHLLDVPSARDMSGKVLLDLWEAAERQRRPVRWVDSYEPLVLDSPSPPLSEQSFDDEAALEQLRSLGYVGDDSVTETEVEEIPSSPEQHNNLGRIHLSNQDWSDAVAAFEQALALDPDNAEALTNLGTVAMQRGQAEEALRWYGRALQANPNNVDAILQIAGLRTARNELPLAESMYRQALALEDRLPPPYIGLGDILQRQGRQEEARQVLEQALALDPRSIEAHYNLGVVYMALGQAEKARQSFEKTLSLESQHAFAHNNLGHLLHKVGETEEALEHLQQAAAADPHHFESRFNLGSILLSQAKPQESLPFLQEAAALRPDLEIAQLRLALAHLQVGDFEEARSRYEVLTRLFPGSAEACLQLARIAMTQADPNQARAWLDLALQRAGPRLRSLIQADPELAAIPEGE